MTPLLGVTLIALVAISLYAIFGGADFGGGVWDLFATGPRREEQRETIGHAIGPVWEANHVWLIFTIVVLFTCFPAAFADIATGLFVPLTLALLGIVLRGAAFIFRNYADAPAVERTWTLVFGIASVIAPFFLGDSAGAIATGRYAWTSPFALSIGFFAVVLTSQIAAVFLLREAGSPEVRGDFRIRAIVATIAVWIAGAAALGLAKLTEPALFPHLIAPHASELIVQALWLGLAVMYTVVRGHDGFARVFVAVETVAILGGWFGAQAPALIPGRFTYVEAAAGDATISAFLVAAGAGSVLLIPSLVLLFAVFKREPQKNRSTN